jgi:polar amino acid transport system permease protein
MNIALIWEARWLLLDSFVVTLYLSATAIVSGTLLGGVITVLRQLKYRPLNLLLRAYIELFRGTPLLMQLFFVYFGLPLLGLPIDRFWAAFTALSLFTSAYVAEVFRSGIESIPKGQSEASVALGMSFFQRLTYIIAPQALRISLPSLIGVYVSVVKDTSLATVVGYNELTRRSMELVLRYGHPFEFFLTVCILYFIICYPISKFSERLERKLAGRTR